MTEKAGRENQLTPSTTTILALDTSSKQGSLALLRADQPLAFYGAATTETHSTRLLDEIDMLLKKSGVALAEIDLFAAVVGPGSFTGLRIGLATIKGLARAGNKSVVGITALAAAARGAGASENVLACVNALRQEIYAQLFRVTRGGECEPLSEAIVAAPQVVLAQFSQQENLVFVGDGALVYQAVIRDFAAAQNRPVQMAAITGIGQNGWTIAPPAPFLALEVAHLAAIAARQGAHQEVASLEAFYVRGADVKVKAQT